MRFKPRYLIYGYAGFCVVNAAVAYFTGSYRTGRVRPVGENKLLDFNDALVRFNVLAYVLPQGAGPAVGAAVAPAVPTGATITYQPSGTTTTFAPG